MRAANRFITLKTRTALQSVSLNVAFTTAFLASCALFGTAATTIALKPGEYALTFSYEVQDQPQNETKTGTRCIAPQDLKNPEKIFNDRLLADVRSEESCIVSGLKSSGGRISYDADCHNRLVHVEGTVGNTEFSVVREVKPKASQEISFRLTLMGKRMGNCKK